MKELYFGKTGKYRGKFRKKSEVERIDKCRAFLSKKKNDECDLSDEKVNASIRKREMKYTCMSENAA